MWINIETNKWPSRNSLQFVVHFAFITINNCKHKYSLPKKINLSSRIRMKISVCFQIRLSDNINQNGLFEDGNDVWRQLHNIVWHVGRWFIFSYKGLSQGQNCLRNWWFWVCWKALDRKVANMWREENLLLGATEERKISWRTLRKAYEWTSKSEMRNINKPVK